MEYLPDFSLQCEPAKLEPYEELLTMTLEEVMDYLLNSPSEIGYFVLKMARDKGLDVDLTFGVMAIALQRRVEKLEIRVDELETTLEKSEEYVKRLEEQISDVDHNAECDARWASWKGLE